MDFEKYVLCMAQKYQVAVAIAVLRNKPDNLTPEQYVAQLKDKIEKQNQENVHFAEDLDVAENDFNFDDDSFTIDDIYQSPNAEENQQITNIRDQKIYDYSHQTKFYENHNIILNETTGEATRSKESTVNNAEVVTEASADETNSLDDILRTLKDIDENKECFRRENYNSEQCHSQIILSPSMINFSQGIVEENITITDSLLNIDIGNLVVKSNTEENSGDRSEATAVKNFSKTNDISKPDDRTKTTNEIAQDTETIVFQNTYEMEVEMALNEILQPELYEHTQGDLNERNNEIFPISNKHTNAVSQAKDDINITDNMNININNNINKDQNVADTNTIDISTQDTILYTVQGYTQNTSYSQSQCQNIEVPKAFIHGSKDKHTFNEVNVNNTQKNNKNERYQDAERENMKKHENITQNPNILTVDSSQIQYIIDTNGRTYAVLNSIHLDKDSSSKNTEVSSERHTNIDLQTENIRQNVSLKINTSMHHQKENTDRRTSLEINTNMDLENTQNITEATQENTDNQTDSQVYDIDEYLDKDTADCEEVVPFKVVKELSRIKAYLNKRDRQNTDYSSDSGYRSDSQSSYKSARISDEWLHQSASCLFHYVTQCPLVAVTQEIVTEISQVLGRLIDRLHEDEKYPLFIEELLQKVDSLLRELRQDGGTPENILLEKDETIQRLLLLNKSIHILKFSIEKITTSLEKAHASLTSKETLYELTNITEVENLRYTFYILEIFIQMYVKVKDSSQNAQSSQETRILKKSSITEIWRRKWNPDVKETKNVGSQEKSCALSRCGEILNKIIVDCMDGYGLVSFAALQCFNLLQS